MSVTRNAKQKSANQYDLFHLSKLVSTGSQRSSIVQIRLTAFGGHTGNAFTVLYCSNDYLIFRHIGESGIPRIRTIKWFKDISKRIVSVSFDPVAQWLLCVTVDSTIVLIPVYFLVARNQIDLENDILESAPSRVNEKQKFGSALANTLKKSVKTMSLGSIKTPTNRTPLDVNDVTIVSLNINEKHGLVKCLWWKSRADGVDYAVLCYSDGTTIFVNLLSQQIAHRVKLRTSIKKASIVITLHHVESYLLVESTEGTFLKMLIEHEVVTHKYDSIILHALRAPSKNQTLNANHSQNPFIPMLLNMFAKGASVDIQKSQSKDGNEISMIGVYDPSTCVYELYDSNLQPDAFPLFIYQLVPNLKHVVWTPKLIFASSSAPVQTQYLSEKGTQIFVFSNLIASSNYAAAKKSNRTPLRDPLMQQLYIDTDIQGVFSAYQSKNFQANDQRMLYENQALHGFYFWTPNTVYECAPWKSPEGIFFSLVSEGLARSSAESFGKSLGLDILSLYEKAADTYFQKGDYGMALDLYYLSNVKVSKLVGQYLIAERMDIVFSTLKASLHQPTALSSTARKNMSDILVNCYIHKLLCADKEDFKQIETEFLSLLRTNHDFDEQAATKTLLKCGMIQYCLEIGHTKGSMESVLQQIAKAGWILDKRHVHYLLERNYTSQLKEKETLHSIVLPTSRLKVMMHDTRELQWGSSDVPLSLWNTKELQKLAALLATQQKLPKPLRSLSANLQLEFYIQLLLQLVSSLAEEHHQTDTAIDATNFSIACGSNHTIASIFVPSDLEGFTGNDVWVSKVYGWGNNTFGQLGTVGEKSFLENPTNVFNSTLPTFGKITQIACGGDFTIFVQDNKMVYSFGKGDRGQLGHGDRMNRNKPQPVELLNNGLKDTNSLIQNIGCGFNFSFIVSNHGNLFGCGAADQGQLGNNNTQDQVNFVSIPTKEIKVSQISCGYCHALCLSDNNQVFSWGNGTHGQLGHATRKDQLVPKLVEHLVATYLTDPVTKISCGFFHSFVITKSSHVFSWGKGTNGRLGHGDEADQLTPKLVQSLEDLSIVDIACGHRHNLALSADGSLYTWGASQNGQLGISVAKPQFSPVQIPPTMFENSFVRKKNAIVSKIVCGEEHSLAITAAGAVYSWGLNSFGQLGHASLSDEPRPRCINALWNVVNTVSNWTENRTSFFQQLLERLLKEHWRYYRPSLMLSRCIQFRNWKAAAVIYECFGDWCEAFECELAHIESQHLNKEEFEQHVLQLFGTLFPKPTNTTIRSQCLVQLFKFWFHHCLETEILEQFLLQNMESLSLVHPLVQLSEQPQNNSLSALPFTTALYQATVRALLKSNLMQNDSNIPNADRKFWSSIKENLQKDHTKRDKLLVTSISGLEKKEYIFFTCGHEIHKTLFYESTLPELKQKLESAKPSITCFSELILGYYHQHWHQVNFACPTCLWSFVTSSPFIHQ